MNTSLVKPRVREASGGGEDDGDNGGDGGPGDGDGGVGGPGGDGSLTLL